VSFALLEVIVGPKNIARNDRGEHATMLLVVSVVLHVDQPLGMAVAKVGRMGRTVMHLKFNNSVIQASKQNQNSYHRLINRVRSFVRKNTRRQAGNHFLHIIFEACVQHVVIYLQIYSLKRLKMINKIVCVAYIISL